MNEKNDTIPYAVIGATGQQGLAVVRPLLEAGEPVRAIVRDPASSTARALAERGVELARADQDNPADLERALLGVRALFLMTTFSGADGPEGEVRRGRTVADAAARAGVPRVVYSSVGGAERRSGIPHFESKRRIEEHLVTSIRSSFVRPTFFMENLADQISDWSSGEFVLRLPMRGDVPLQMVGVTDIGRVSAALLRDPDLLGDADSVEIAGDEQTLDSVATIIGDHLGTGARYESLPGGSLDGDEDLAAMFSWFQETAAYAADFATTRRLDPELQDLPSWLRIR